MSVHKNLMAIICIFLLTLVHSQNTICTFQFFYKDAGFVYESFLNKTNQVIWNFWSYKLNPRNKSLENRPTKQIHKTNLWKTGLRNKSTKRIFGKQAYETNPRYKSLRFGFANPDLQICQPGFARIRFML